MDFKNIIRRLLIFIIPRYPLFQVLTFLMFLGERAKINTTPPFNPIIIYIYCGVMFLTALGMSLKAMKPQASIFSCFLIACMGSLFYNNENLKYQSWLKIRIFQSLLGSIWTLLLYAYFSYKKPRPQLLRRAMELVASLVMISEFFSLWYSERAKADFDYLVSSSSIVFYTYITITVLIALSFYNQFYTYEGTIVMAILWMMKLFFSNLNFHYWCQKRKVDYWIQVRMAGDGVMFIMGTIFYVTSFIRVSPEPVRQDANNVKKD